MICNLCITTNQIERDYFDYLLTTLIGKYICFVHLDFNSKDKYGLLKLNKKNVNYRKIVINGNLKFETSGQIQNFEQLVDLFEPCNGVFIYSGHSDGIFMIRKKIRIFRVEDIVELAYRVNGNKKLELIVFDCCLCGNINCLNICFDYTEYVISSSGYWPDLSILQTKSFYKGDYISAINELIEIETNAKGFISNYCLYHLNESLLELIQLTLDNLQNFNSKKGVVIENGYYKDLECTFKELNISIKPLLEKCIKYQRFDTKRCYIAKKSKKANKSYPSSLMVILRSPVRKGPPTLGSIFYK
jgi:hypothetical protein